MELSFLISSICPLALPSSTMNVCWGCSIQRFQKAIKVYCRAFLVVRHTEAPCLYQNWMLENVIHLIWNKSQHKYTETEIQRKSSYDCLRPHQLAAFLLRCVWPLVTLLWRWDRCETGKEIETFVTGAGLMFGSHTTAPQWQREIETKRVPYLKALILASCTSQWLFPDNPLRINLAILCTDFKTMKNICTYAHVFVLFAFLSLSLTLQTTLVCSCKLSWLSLLRRRPCQTHWSWQAEPRKLCICRSVLVHSKRASRLGHLRHRQHWDVFLSNKWWMY